MILIQGEHHRLHPDGVIRSKACKADAGALELGRRYRRNVASKRSVSGVLKKTQRSQGSVTFNRCRD